MRQVNIRKLRKDLALELGDLPFEVIRNGVVVARVDYPVKIVSTTTNNGPLISMVPARVEKVAELRNSVAEFFHPMQKKGGK